VLEISDVIAQSSKYESLSPADVACRHPEAWLIVPLRTADQLVGFVVLTAAAREDRP